MMGAASDVSIRAASGRNVSCPNLSVQLFLEALFLVGQRGVCQKFAGMKLFSSPF